MKKKALIWHLYPSYLLLAGATMAAVALSASRITKHFYYEQTEKQLTSVANLLAQQMSFGPDLREHAEVDRFFKTLGHISGYRLTAITPGGTVIADSEKNPVEMDNHGDREEIVQALRTGGGQSCRYSDTLKQNMMYVATAVEEDGQPRLIIRASLSLGRINGAIRRIWLQIALAALVTALAAAVATVLLARNISRQLANLRTAAEAYGSGNSQVRCSASDISEVDILGRTMNTMADQLEDRIGTVRRQRDEQAALLRCMVEGVFAVDMQKHLTKMNASVLQLFGLKPEQATGRGVAEVLRNADLLQLVDETMLSEESVEREIYLPDAQRYLQGHGSVLQGSDGNRIGAVFVLNDVTRMRRIERMRRDFVANVSHELKTPITSILGFADTLRSSVPVTDEDRDHFLGIIDAQAVRLKSIVEDLLALSSIEDGAEQRSIEFQPGRVCSILRSAAQSNQDAAAKKNIVLNMSCPEDLTASLNLQLVEQAVSNLISNAVRYSDEATAVTITGEASGTDVLIRVKDQGPGITAKHIPRLFERFYRIDKSRSRRLGGTGLGLSIVKHIALAHGGRVTVDSEPGKGSTFSIVLPQERL